MSLPPVVSDPDVCPYVHQDPETGRWYDAPHDWYPADGYDWDEHLVSHPDIEVCRYCGGRKP